MAYTIDRRRLVGGAALLAGAGGFTSAFAADATMGRWKRAESPNFIVYADAQEKELRVFVDKLEQFDWTLRLMHGLDLTAPTPHKLDVYLVSDRKLMQRASPGLSELVGGYYRATLRAVFAIAERDSAMTMSRAGWEETTLFHEYTHHFMLRYFPYAYPAWLVEGYAEYFGVTTIDGPRIEIGKFSTSRVNTLMAKDDWLPLKDVLGGQVGSLEGKKDEKKVLMFYAQAWLLTHYMVSDPERNKQLHAYMASVAKGGDPVESLYTELGVTEEGLTNTLHDYDEGRINGLRLTRKTVVADSQVAVTPLPRSADDLLLESLRGGEMDDKAAAAFLATVQAKAAPYPADRFAQIMLARTECAYGDHAKGKAILDRFPDDPEALELAARVRLDEGGQTNDADKEHALAVEATPYIGKAFKLDPNRYQTLWTYVRSRMILDKRYPSENTLNVMMTALDLAPQVSEIRFQAAQALMFARHYPEAIETLGPLLNDPHGSNESAQRLLKAIQEAQARDKGA